MSHRRRLKVVILHGEETEEKMLATFTHWPRHYGCLRTLETRFEPSRKKNLSIKRDLNIAQ